MQTILLIFVVAECLLLLGLTLFGKFTKKVFAIISLITALCCGAVLILMGGSSAPDREDAVKGHVYMAAKLLEQERPEDALNALGQITDAEGAPYGAAALRALAYNRSCDYTSGAYLLKDAQEEGPQQLYRLCQDQVPCDDALARQLIDHTFTALDLTQAQQEKLDAEMAIRYLRHSDSVSDSMLAQICTAVRDEDQALAFDLALQNAENGTVTDNILVSEMFVKGYDNLRLAEEDEAYDLLLQNLTDVQIRMNRVAADAGTDSKEYKLAHAAYQVALQELQNEHTNRAINYLALSQPSEDSVYHFAYQLQMAKLLYLTGETELATACLETVFANKIPDSSQWLAVDVLLLREAYLDGAGSMENYAYDTLYLQLMENLYQGVFSESVHSDFYSFVYNYLKDLFSGIYIGKPDTSKFPAVTVSVSTSEALTISPDSVLLTDTGSSIDAFTVDVTPNASMAISLVLDRSGSMNGQRIIDSRQAIRSFALSMDEGTSASLVSFANSARVDCPLVDVPYIIAAQVENIAASGGTNISSGLLCGAQQLDAFPGNKVIVLLSDGVDGNNSAMKQTLNTLKSNSIVVYTIGLPGCDEAYLSNIAAETGGTYFPASNSNVLESIYNEIRGLLRHSYTVSYQAADTEVAERSIRIEAVDALTQSRRAYTTTSERTEDSLIYDAQASNYFTQIGGTMGGN